MQSFSLAWWCYYLAPLDTIPIWDFGLTQDIAEEVPRLEALINKFGRFYELCTPESDRILDSLYDAHLVLFQDHSDPVPLDDDGDDLVGDDVDEVDDDVAMQGRIVLMIRLVEDLPWKSFKMPF